MPDTTEPTLWSIRDVAEYLGVKPRSASGLLSRWGVKAVRYELGPGGRPEARFDPDQVGDAAARRPGRGARTDLRPAAGA
jgi:hypothetical protein